MPVVEVEEAFDAGDPSLLVFEAQEVLERVEEQGDLFAPALTLRQALPDLRGRPPS